MGDTRYQQRGGSAPRRHAGTRVAGHAAYTGRQGAGATAGRRLRGRECGTSVQEDRAGKEREGMDEGRGKGACRSSALLGGRLLGLASSAGPPSAGGRRRRLAIGGRSTGRVRLHVHVRRSGRLATLVSHAAVCRLAAVVRLAALVAVRVRVPVVRALVALVAVLRLVVGLVLQGRAGGWVGRQQGVGVCGSGGLLGGSQVGGFAPRQPASCPATMRPPWRHQGQSRRAAAPPHTWLALALKSSRERNSSLSSCLSCSKAREGGARISNSRRTAAHAWDLAKPLS